MSISSISFGLCQNYASLVPRKKRLKSFTGQRFSSFILYPPTTPQSAFPVVDQRLPRSSVWIFRGSCGGNRRTPLTGVSERVLPQRGHSTTVTELAVNQLRSMGMSVRENMHLGEVL